MQFVDMWHDSVITLRDVRALYLSSSENVGSFARYVARVIRDTCAGRNDCAIIGLTRREIAGLLKRLEAGG